MIRTILSFIYWKHIKAALWTSGIIFILCVLFGLAVNYFKLQSALGVSAGAMATIGTIVTILGVLSFISLIFSYLLFRRRRIDGSLNE